MTVASKPNGNRGRGRPKGSKNKSVAEVKALALTFGPEAINKLVDIMRNGETSAVRTAAIKELLDRGLGKPAQPIGQDPDLSVLGIIVIPGKSE